MYEITRLFVMPFKLRDTLHVLKLTPLVDNMSFRTQDI